MYHVSNLVPDFDQFDPRPMGNERSCTWPRYNDRVHLVHLVSSRAPNVLYSTHLIAQLTIALLELSLDLRSLDLSLLINLWYLDNRASLHPFFLHTLLSYPGYYHLDKYNCHAFEAAGPSAGAIYKQLVYLLQHEWRNTRVRIKRTQQKHKDGKGRIIRRKRLGRGARSNQSLNAWSDHSLRT